MNLEARIDMRLKEMGCELWPGEAFYLTDPRSRADAVKWLAELIRDIEH